MREILFRGKRVDNGEWAYGSFGTFRAFDDELHSAIIPEQNGENFLKDMVSVLPETVGQYAGQKDKNGEKIFDGDIVKHTTKLAHLGLEDYSEIGEVLEHKGCWAITNNYGYIFFVGVLKDDYIEIEVIGNIYDNPGLLEGKRDAD